MEKLERDHPDESARSDAVTNRCGGKARAARRVGVAARSVRDQVVVEATEYLNQKREKLRQIIEERMVEDAALAEANEGGAAPAAAAAMVGGGSKGKGRLLRGGRHGLTTKIAAEFLTAVCRRGSARSRHPIAFVTTMSDH